MTKRYMIHVFYFDGTFKTFELDDPNDAICTIIGENGHANNIIVWDNELEEYLQ